MNKEDTGYIPTDYLDEARLVVDDNHNYTKATALALISIVQELRELKQLLRKATTQTGEFEVRIAGAVKTWDETQL